MPLPLWAIPSAISLGGAALSAIGGSREAKEQRRAEQARHAALQASLADYDTRMGPVMSQLQAQVSGALTPEEQRMREQYLMMQRGQQEREMARAYQRGQKVWSPYGEQNTERALRFGQESEREAAQRQYDANVAYSMGLQQHAGQRSQFATSALANLQAQRLNASMGVAGATPTSTSGIGQGLGQIGAAAMQFGAGLYADSRRGGGNVPAAPNVPAVPTSVSVGTVPSPFTWSQPDTFGASVVPPMSPPAIQSISGMSFTPRAASNFATNVPTTNYGISRPSLAPPISSVYDRQAASRIRPPARDIDRLASSLPIRAAV